MEDSVCGVVWVIGFLMLMISGPWWWWGYGMGRRLLWTKTTGAFYWWHFESTEIPWHPRTSCCSRTMHGAMLQGSVHNIWQLKTSLFLQGILTGHPLSMFGMLRISIYSVYQFLLISSNFAQPLKRSRPTIYRPQLTTWSTLHQGDVLHCMGQMVVTPDTGWFSEGPFMQI